jgi:putative transposase
MPDHIHILVSISPNIAISDLVRNIKANSSSFIKEKFVKDFRWQEGFGAFCYGKRNIEKVVAYILEQPERHRPKTFRKEYIEFL